MKFLVSIEQDEDGYYVAECPALPGCFSQGQTREEALANIADAIRLSVRSRSELGLPHPLEIAEVEVAV
jgi:predicted RNase H-like HicB family nuclease